MAAIDADSLTFCFEAILQGTEWESLQLEIKRAEARRQCGDCGHEFKVIDYNSECAACGSSNTASTGGDELDFEYLEVETDGAPVTQVESVK
jgi:hydrogenase nickel incorporation protein HypA/HybF